MGAVKKSIVDDFIDIGKPEPIVCSKTFSSISHIFGSSSGFDRCFAFGHRQNPNPISPVSECRLGALEIEPVKTDLAPKESQRLRSSIVLDKEMVCMSSSPGL